MKKRLSLGILARKLSQAARRFPLSMLLVVALAVLCFCEIHGEYGAIDYRVWLFCGIGTLWSIAAVLWVEERTKNPATQLIALAALLLWGMYCLFLPAHEHDLQAPQAIRCVTFGATALLALFFISFLRKETDRAFWNFTARTLGHTVLAGLFSLVLWGGLSLALKALDILFHLEISDDPFADLAVVCFVLFAPLYLLSNMPDREKKQDGELRRIPVLKVLGLYILTPILTIYAVILYAYLFKILAAWELPDGWVSWLVTVLGTGGLLVIACLFPLRTQNRVVGFLSRWSGVVILPLLVLMTIGIARRIGDYGLTINRCYILLLNIWFYGIYLYLFLTGARRIKWIVISPVVLALLACVGPWSAANVARRSIAREVNDYLNGTQISLANPAIDRTDTKGLRHLRSNIDYLYYHYGEESILPFFSDRIERMTPSNIFAELDIDDYLENSEGSRYFSTDNLIKTNRIAPILGQFDRFVPIVYYGGVQENEDLELSVQGDQFTIRLLAENRTFRLPLRQLADGVATIEAADFTLLLTECSGFYYESENRYEPSQLSGYLFYKQSN